MDFQEDNLMLIATEGPKLENTKTSAVIVGLAQCTQKKNPLTQSLKPHAFTIHKKDWYDRMYFN